MRSTEGIRWGDLLIVIRPDYGRMEKQVSRPRWSIVILDSYFQQYNINLQFVLYSYIQIDEVEDQIHPRKCDHWN